MIENEMQNEIHEDGSEKSKEELLQMYNSTLKYCKGRSLSLNVIVASKQQTEYIHDDLKTYESINENTLELLNGTMLFQSFKKLIELIQGSIAGSQIMNSNNIELHRELFDKINGVIHFSKSLIKLYQEKISELNIIAKKKAYICAHDEYCSHLDAMSNKITQPENDDSMALEKARLQIYKINLMRAIKAVLIGFTSAYDSDLFQKFEQFNYSLKRNLTMDDFVDTWDIGLSS